MRLTKLAREKKTTQYYYFLEERSTINLISFGWNKWFTGLVRNACAHAAIKSKLAAATVRRPAAARHMHQQIPRTPPVVRPPSSIAMAPSPSDGQLGSEPTMEDAKSLLPYTTVDSSLRALAGQAEGFGRHAIGGLHGDVYHVTTLEGILLIDHRMELQTMSRCRVLTIIFPKRIILR
jgi:hypothetical protein